MLRKKVSCLFVGFLLTILLFSASNIIAFSVSTEKKPLRSFDPSKVVDMREEVAAKSDQYPFDPKDPPPKYDLDNPQKGPQDWDNHHAWGADIEQQNEYFPPFGFFDTIWGARGYHSVNDSLTLASESWLYAATIKAPSPCPLEVTTVYHLTSGSVMERYVGIWDHEDEPGFSETFSLNYLRNVDWLEEDGDLEYYDVVIWYDDSAYEWGVYFYDFDDEVFDLVYTQEDDNYDHGGWDFYEAYYNGTWTESEYVDADLIMVYHVTSISPLEFEWVDNTAPYGDELDAWPSFNLAHGFFAGSNYYNWYVGS